MTRPTSRQRILSFLLILLLANLSQQVAVAFGFDETAFEEAIDDTFDGVVRGYAAVLVTSDGIEATASGGDAQAPGDGDVLMSPSIYSGIGSVSKMLSGIALLNLFDKHVLSNDSVQAQLDTEIWSKLPQKWQDEYGGNVENITYRQLLQHKSGFRISSNGEANIPGSATGHQMRYMIEQDVALADVDVRKYNNFNFTILLFLIPAIAYPDEVADIHDTYKDDDVVDYSIAINEEYGALYEQYMQEEIFPNTLSPITPTCRPSDDLNTDEYAKWYDSAVDNSGEVLMPTYCRSQGGWYITARQLATFAQTYAFTNRFIGPTTRASLFDPDATDDRLLYNFTKTYDDFEFDQSVFAYHGGTQAGYRAALVVLPYGFFGVAMANSPELSSGDIAEALIEAFDAATDESPPSIGYVVLGTLGAGGWYTSNVTVNWSVSDPDSAISSTDGCGSSTVTVDTNAAGQTYTCTATSLGGTASESVTVRRDATSPSVSVVGVQDGDSFAAADPPTITCSASDASPGSGIIDPNPTPVITDDGGGFFTARCDAGDGAGNTASENVTYKLVTLDVIADEVAASDLNDGQVNSLLVKLEQAQVQLDKDKIKQAVNTMEAFENQVLSLLEEGVLPISEGQVLLDDIRVMIEYYESLTP